MISTSLIPIETIGTRILLIRGQKVMLDTDLADLYGVPVKSLNQALRRNKRRFPTDFAFQLTRQEMSHSSRSQIVTLKRGHNIKYRQFAFTEQGVAMLSSVLHSPRAIQVNIAIMRAFVKLRQWLASHADLARKLEEMEKEYDENFRTIFEAIRALTTPALPKNRRKIGFKLEGVRTQSN